MHGASHIKIEGDFVAHLHTMLAITIMHPLVIYETYVHVCGPLQHAGEMLTCRRCL